MEWHRQRRAALALEERRAALALEERRAAWQIVREAEIERKRREKG